MWVYADREINLCIADEAERIAADWRIASVLQPGLSRHALCVRMLIRAGMIWQARADADFIATGSDSWPRQDAPDRALARACADLVRESVMSLLQQPIGFAPHDALRALMRDERILLTRIPEGFAFYDLYPEFMIAPTRNLPMGDNTYVIGLRSIGTALAAMVASVVRTSNCASVRPIGDPFDRALSVNTDWIAKIRDADCVAITDEGPGLSGSSFAAAGRAVMHATGRDNLVFLPTHGGDPGIAATVADRTAWQSASRHVMDRSLFDKGPFARANWFADVIGPALRVTDLSGGQWRAALGLDEAFWPACDPMQERVKLKVETANGAYLLKFSGLTPLTEHAFEHAQEFSSRGFGLRPLAERHGMMLWQWCDGAKPLLRDHKSHVLPMIADMLSFRAMHWTSAMSGASVQDLFDMARDNLNEALGYDKAAVLNEWEPYLDAIAAASTPVRIDGRLDCHEFLLLPDDHIVKTDALDHHAAHDLIGCQDIFWDVAGAMIEWTLSRDDVQRICERIDKVTGFRRPREALAFYVIAYTAFRLGAATMSAEALAEVNPAEARRFQRRVQFYRDAAFTLLQSSLIGA